MSVRRIVVVAGRQSEDYSRSSIRGNHMNLGVPSAAGFSNSLWSVFFKRQFRRDEPSPRWSREKTLRS